MANVVEFEADAGMSGRFYKRCQACGQTRELTAECPVALRAALDATTRLLRGAAQIWALCDPGAPKVRRRIRRRGEVGGA
jgi:hypothetical protein